ncbi:MAG: hypothetical protein G5Z42_01185 [Caldisphaeraceae archaeon]|nr:hypothetical protein [Caldisphaeraceae archaeon]MEB3691272.1 hypothetical protein [Caldisphaeraceae archaeon]MEB3797418.1 hypothetical protein [Caldisphaeraceae archaeon]
MNKVTLTVKPICIPYGNKKLGQLKLHTLQERVYETINQGNSVTLSTPTGSGKTLTLLLATNYGGAVGVYPNNTLLMNQRKSITNIITKYSKIGKCVGYFDINNKKYETKCPDDVPDSPLIIFEINDPNGVLKDYGHIGLLTVSGETIKTEESMPKREFLYSLAEKAFSYKDIYIITLTTPDTFLLLYSGAYRDLQVVGKLVHNLLQLLAEGKDSAIIENELRKTMTASRSVLAPIIGLKARLLEYPLFIDEFHLYGKYELDALYAILKLNKEVSLEEYPIIFSSATPARDTLEELEKELGIRYETIEYRPLEDTCNGFKVRGKTEVDIVGIDSTNYRGLGAYYHVGDRVSDKLLNNYKDEIKNVVKSNRKVMVILDRVYQVFWTVEDLIKGKLNPVECHVSIPHPRCTKQANIVIGSNRLTQGISVEDIVFLASTAVGVEDAIQRFGRSGRGGLDSHVVLFAPKDKVNKVNNQKGKRLSYDQFIKEILEKLYVDITSRSREWSKMYTALHNIRRELIYAVSISSIARVAGLYRLFKKVIEYIDREKAKDILNSWVYGGSDTYAHIMRFRKTGFKVKYRIKGNNDIEEDDIGIIIRNAKINNINRNILEIDPWNAPTTVKQRDIVFLDGSTIKERLVKGRIMLLSFLIAKHGVELFLDNSSIKPISDVLLYIPLTPPPEDYKLFIVQSGEAVLANIDRKETVAYFL